MDIYFVYLTVAVDVDKFEGEALIEQSFHWQSQSAKCQMPIPCQDIKNHSVIGESLKVWELHVYIFLYSKKIKLRLLFHSLVREKSRQVLSVSFSKTL